MIGPFCFGDQDTIESMTIFRIDGRTIKREALIRQLDHLVPLCFGILALHFRPSAHSVRSDQPLKNVCENANNLHVMVKHLKC